MVGFYISLYGIPALRYLVNYVHSSLCVLSLDGKVSNLDSLGRSRLVGDGRF